MGERSGYEPGTFCWVELATSDQPGAKQFYGSLFGWEAEDLPMGEGAFYSMMSVRGKQVAAIAPQPQQQRDAGVPPLWNSFISVENADEVVERAMQLGGGAHAPAFDVFDSGRMAVLTDPQGAYFMVWQPGSHSGAALVNEPGALVWNELASPDLDGASEFYSQLFGWTVSLAPDMDMRYLMIANRGAGNGGMTEPMPPGTPPHWLAYFAVQDIDSALARVGELGGTVMAGPIDVPNAKIGVVADPQGAVFALYAGELDP